MVSYWWQQMGVIRIKRQMGIPAEVKDFGKTLIVCKMNHEIEHENIAYSVFIMAER